ncbi:MAG: class I tRNA ligase family protein [Phycisphaerales bacterium]
MPPFYITTPIYYVNDRPHIGHCYTTLVADVAARFQRLIRGSSPAPVTGGSQAPQGEAGEGVFLLTGTDEHADKVVVSAREHGVSPQEWADRNAAEFKRAFEFMGVWNDDFIRTTEPRHKDKVPGYIRRLMKHGDVYKGEYTGWYDPGQEEYVTETVAKENEFKSPISGKPLVKRTEPCYFFKLSKYQAALHKHIEDHPEFLQPDSRRSEILARVRPPAVLNDIPISRPVTDDPATQWGVRMPDDPAHRVYVWIDALFNYYTAVDTPERKHLWPPAVHLMGKDIIWFHAVIWPCMLMALDVPLPRTIYAHGWWISEGKKMSKSLGNFIDLEQLQAYAARYGLDALRWYLATQGPLASADADFAHAKFVEVYNADLANGIGNCASRVANMIEKYCSGQMPEHSGRGWHTTRVQTPSGVAAVAENWPETVKAHLLNTAREIDQLLIPNALHTGRTFVSLVDGYINIHEPFKKAKRMAEDPAIRIELFDILHNCAEALRITSLLLYPAMPFKMAELWRRWNCSPLRDPADPNSGFVAPLEKLAEWGGPHSLKPGTPIVKGDALFMRADPAEPPPKSS